MIHIRHTHRHHVDHFVRNSKSFPDKELTRAKAFLTKMQHDVLSNEYVDPKAGELLFRTYTREWRKGQSADASTRQTVTSHLDNGIFPFPGDKSLRAVEKTETILRQMEIFGFSPDDVDREEMVANIQRQIRWIGNTPVFAPPKDGKTRLADRRRSPGRNRRALGLLRACHSHPALARTRRASDYRTAAHSQARRSSAPRRSCCQRDDQRPGVQPHRMEAGLRCGRT
ncbi:hypothetical protein AB0M80_28375 [Amycolatopsis sp. NPDC051045]|uniref:hypothetical protein n=1 Tax=Amycolatopsis sp. NPDC051045 TaxID=3156922 RepID=UPI00343A4507